ncbi:LICD family protein [Streptococcus oralis SK255]|uniref:LICD family protein n=1 Tax=Streptococcus oralis SK255 TaxID=1005704 RepID=F5VT17_STROR|nr:MULTISPECIES: phosphorylcholine transferase LicD [Streptococcus]EFM35799.1 LICD family protein [Streptococcus sp. oral taxon 071 str. 73H25AP]EGL91247.1 LICD family protein [Streptococcus oralis SK255]ORO44881.1 phosphorylcholine transferase LicD [Streptococcus oralis subsp. tigurinus]
MRKLSIEEAKKIELDILDFIDSFCKEHGINYCINYGTLIGAIRHKGFIPWDDDIDLSMTRENYEKFIQLFSEKQSRYKLLSLETDDQYFNNFIKIVDPTTKIIDTRNTKTYDSGVFIDIFPMDTFNDTKVVDICYKLESFKLLSFSKHKNIVYGDSKLKDLIRTLFWLLLRPISPRFFAHQIEKQIQKYRVKDGKYIAFIPSKLKEKEVFTKEIFEDLIEVPFEHRTLSAPKQYDVILKQYYGDYMTLPPKEKQIYIHEFEAYKLED